MDEEKLQRELEKFRREHPEWGKGELRDLDEDPRERFTYRKPDGSYGHDTILSYSDMPLEPDEEDTFEEDLSQDQNFFVIHQTPDKGGDLDFYRDLSGEEAVILFSTMRDMTQEQLADYFAVSVGKINKLRKRAIEKIKAARSVTLPRNR